MIKRELYMNRIRPFIGTELIKVMTGIRRCGKSVMLELIKQELIESGVSETQLFAINFEDLSYSHLQTAQALHDEVIRRAKEIDGKVYLFGDNPFQLAVWAIQPPKPDSVSHPKLFIGCFRNTVYPFLSSRLNATEFKMAHFHTIKTVEAIIRPQPYKTFGIFINGIHQQSG